MASRNVELSKRQTHPINVNEMISSFIINPLSIILPLFIYPIKILPAWNERQKGRDGEKGLEGREGEKNPKQNYSDYLSTGKLRMSVPCPRKEMVETTSYLFQQCG